MIEKVWDDFFKKKSSKSREQLIVHYLFVVSKVVKKMSRNFPSHIQHKDLYASGVTGLIKAVDKYDPDKKVKFEYYAPLYIKGAIVDEVRSLDWYPRSFYQKNQKLQKAKDHLEQKYQREVTDREIAEELNCSLSDLKELRKEVESVFHLPLNQSSTIDEDGLHLSEKIADQQISKIEEVTFKKEVIEYLKNAMHLLSKQEKQVLQLYYYEEKLLKEIGKKLKISESRVSQIHTQAITKLRCALKEIN